ncbi:MAG: adenosylcobinamide-GDP ribazoletransferase [Rectinema subterraneum]|uniref:adenosylcobinamide-GDP ribazoletransferase n=1 Tax=Rectinema subterraneum TaxID=2653714 RepID=UPI003C7E6061
MQSIKNKYFRRFLSVFTLVSRIPVHASFEPDFSQADFWIPVLSPLVSIIAIVGFWGGLVLSRSTWIAAGVSIAAQYFIFNLFHFDGFVDTADAMLPFASAERRLEILKDPRAGSYGLFAGLVAFALRTGAIVRLASMSLYIIYQGTSANGDRGISTAIMLALCVAPLAGRLASVLIPLWTKPARQTGLGALMKGFSFFRILSGTALGLVLSYLLFLGILQLGTSWSWITCSGLVGVEKWGRGTEVWALYGLATVAALLSGFSSAAFYAYIYKKNVGGFTGDALGAAIESGEILCLLALAAVFSIFS